MFFLFGVLYYMAVSNLLIACILASHFHNSARVVRQVFTDKGTELLSNDRPLTFTGAIVAYNFKDVALGDAAKNSDWTRSRKLFHSTLKVLFNYN